MVAGVFTQIFVCTTMSSGMSYLLSEPRAWDCMTGY